MALSIDKSTKWRHKLGFSDQGTPTFAGEPNDIIIIVVGLVGSGKSSFIHDLTADPEVIVGDQLDRCTRRVSAYCAPLPFFYLQHLGSRRLVIVDTPGFDSYQEEWEVLRQVSQWLSKSYDPRKTVTGIVHMSDILTVKQISRSSMDLIAQSKLCGRTDCKRMAMVTSKWDCLSNRNAGIMHEGELQASLWAPSLEQGAKILRIEKKPEDVHAVVNWFLQHAVDELIAGSLSDGVWDPKTGARDNSAAGVHSATYERSGKPKTVHVNTKHPGKEYSTPTSIVIAVIGQMGAGKSTFINKYMGSTKAVVGDGLELCTRHISAHATNLNDGRRLLLVDTPGLDDMPRDEDKKVLKNLSNCLINYRSRGTPLAGVIYIQDISRKRGNYAAQAHLSVLTPLLSPYNELSFPIALVTTQWDGVARETAARTQAEFEGTFWKELIKQGACVYRADVEGCQVEIINNLLELKT